MNAPSRVESGIGVHRSERYHHWRKIKDRVTRRLISLGGISVILAVVLILFYLAWVVFPLFLPPSADRETLGRQQGWADQPVVFSAVEEQLEVGLRIDATGHATFFRIEDLTELHSEDTAPPGAEFTVAAEAAPGSGLLALADAEGNVLLLRHRYATNFDGGVENRHIVPLIDYPYGAQPRALAPGHSIEKLAYADTETGVVIAAVAGRTLFLESYDKQENFLTGEVTLVPSALQADLHYEASGLAISGNLQWLYGADRTGRIHVHRVASLEQVESIAISDTAITEIRMLLGGISLLAGDESGRIVQLFPVRDDQNLNALTVIREFEQLDDSVTQIIPEARRKGFIAIDALGNIGLYHSTAGRRVLKLDSAGMVPEYAALSPRANGLLLLTGVRADWVQLENDHPEVSFTSLWRKVWYENYTEPQYVWQSSAASNEFEPKFSLTPLAFGTLKAALFAMLFAVPLSLMGAAFTAYFMAPRLREMVKPAIEIMAALPTVILGFLAGLWFAPFIEDNLSSLVSLLLILPLGLLLFAFAWSQYQGRFRSWVPEGWEPVLLLPVLVALVYVALLLAGPLQDLLFHGDMRNWLSQELGISYDQRNALVVGFAMGFAVIPTIYSMAEDAVFGVPKSLSDGSLALGATPWQTLVRVVLPTASPGIFSALMIGLGRAVGETMIVLMATGNTPVMDWSIFEGMRTLAANIAVEMPESEVNSSHYRILFLAALVLFLFTFVVNTGAELIRQRLRERYSSL